MRSEFWSQENCFVDHKSSSATTDDSEARQTRQLSGSLKSWFSSESEIWTPLLTSWLLSFRRPDLQNHCWSTTPSSTLPSTSSTPSPSWRASSTRLLSPRTSGKRSKQQRWPRTRTKSRRERTKCFQTFWLATRCFFCIFKPAYWQLVHCCTLSLCDLGAEMINLVGNQMAAEDAQYLASEGVTHLLNTASGDNKHDGVKFISI